MFKHPRANAYGAAAALQLSIVTALPLQALAWGEDGHRIIAEIAEQHLTMPTAARVRDLLATENVVSLPAISMWADYIRLQRPNTARWHYVDIPVHPIDGRSNDYDPARDCIKDDCIVAKIDQFRNVLQDTRGSITKRVEALKFLVHFAGDIHQPLHRALRDFHVKRKLIDIAPRFIPYSICRCSILDN
jgi:hypothetical protein